MHYSTSSENLNPILRIAFQIIPSLCQLILMGKSSERRPSFIFLQEGEGRAGQTYKN